MAGLWIASPEMRVRIPSSAPRFKRACGEIGRRARHPTRVGQAATDSNPRPVGSSPTEPAISQGAVGLFAQNPRVAHRSSGSRLIAAGRCGAREPTDTNEATLRAYLAMNCGIIHVSPYLGMRTLRYERGQGGSSPSTGTKFSVAGWLVKAHACKACDCSVRSRGHGPC